MVGACAGALPKPGGLRCIGGGGGFCNLFAGALYFDFCLLGDAVYELVCAY